MGKKILILGNGPSLNGQRHLMAEVGEQPTFCCTRMSLWDGLCFTPTYYVCNLDLVRMGIEPELPPHREAKFIISFTGEELWGWIPWRKASDVCLSLQGEPLRSGGSMPYIAAQIAVRLGYRRLYFLGIEQQGKGHCFDPEGKANPFIPHGNNKLFERWGDMKTLYERMGCELQDCTPDGRLNEVLGYMPLEEVLRGDRVLAR